MQLNRFTDYACRALMYAAVHDGERCTVDDIAAAFAVSRHHLVKVVNELQHLGYLETRRGRSGGLKLARLPADIRLGTLVRQTEASLALVECFERDTTCPLNPACRLQGVLREATEAFLDVLDRYSLADLVAQPRHRSRVIALLPLLRRDLSANPNLVPKTNTNTKTKTTARPHPRSSSRSVH
jgi:Rrf2 family nitric oxide-sensitive transcriptional repressor